MALPKAGIEKHSFALGNLALVLLGEGEELGVLFWGVGRGVFGEVTTEASLQES